MAHHVALYILMSSRTQIEHASVDCGGSIHHTKQCRTLRDHLLLQENYCEYPPGVLSFHSICKSDISKTITGRHTTVPFYYDTLEEMGYRLVSSFSNTVENGKVLYTLIYRGEEK